jgi:aspartate/methionine/tyrosine aminotransferase
MRRMSNSRARYRTKFDLADRLLKGRFNYTRPKGGFCLWLNVSAHGNDEIATQKIWREAGVRVIPGSYLATTQADGSNPGRNYIRVTLVQDEATTEDALNRILATLDQVQAA